MVVIRREEPPNDLISIQEACLHARVARRTIYYWIKTDKIRLWRTVGGRPRVSRAELIPQVPKYNDDKVWVYYAQYDTFGIELRVFADEAAAKLHQMNAGALRSSVVGARVE